MTILQLQQLYFIANSSDDAIDKSIKMVGAITGLTPDKVEKMKMKRFNKLCAKINAQFESIGKKVHSGKPVRVIRIGTRLYQMNYEVSKKPFNAGKYVEGLTFGKDVITNLHKIMATLATPIRFSFRKMKFVPYERTHEEIATDMERANFDAAYHAAVFFYTLYRVSIQITLPYLVKELESKGVNREKAEQTIMTSLQILDGFTMPKWSQTLKIYLLNRFGISG